MKRLEVITYPRSGFHLLKGLTRICFGDKLKSADIHYAPLNNLDTNPAVSFQKNHDFGLTTEIRDDRDYLVLIRYPIDSLVSYFLLQVKMFGHEDSRASWELFSKVNMGYWKLFYKKWVLSDVIPRRLIVNYGDLINDPNKELTRLVKYMDDGDGITKETIEKALQEIVVKKQNSISKFKYYRQGGAQYFDKLEQMVNGIKGVDIKNKTLMIEV